MPVPSAITDLSTTAGSNYPAGTDTPTTGDDVLRALSSFIAVLRDQLNNTNNTGTVKNPVLSGTATASGTFTMPDFYAGYVQTPNVSSVAAFRSTTQTLVAGTNTLLFNVESFDRANNFDTTTGIFTAPVTGIYQLNCTLRLQNASISSAALDAPYFSRNNTATIGTQDYVQTVASLGDSALSVNPASNSFTLGGSCLMLLSATDTARIKATHTGGNLWLLLGSHFSARFVG